MSNSNARPRPTSPPLLATHGHQGLLWSTFPSLLGAYSRFHIEDHTQRDGEVETMAIRALHKAKFQQLGISDFHTA